MFSNPYLVAHIHDVSLVLFAVWIIEIRSKVKPRSSEIAVVFLLLHAFAIDFCGASWARASEGTDRVSTHK